MKIKLGKKYSWLPSIFTILIAVGLLVTVLLIGMPASGTADPQSTTSNYMLSDEVVKLSAMLDRPGMSTLARASLQEKLEMAERMAAQQAAGAAQPRTAKSAPVQPKTALNIEVEPQEFFEGIVEGSDGMIRPSLADVQNLWQGTRAGNQFQVFAGAYSLELGGEGVVILVDLSSSEPYWSPIVYPAPVGTGPLRIVDISDTHVILTTQSGAPLTFHLFDRTFGN
jgi:hypothetical protein